MHEVVNAKSNIPEMGCIIQLQTLSKVHFLANADKCQSQVFTRLQGLFVYIVNYKGKVVHTKT
jgi:hypothetical protein